MAKIKIYAKSLRSEQLLVCKFTCQILTQSISIAIDVQNIHKQLIFFMLPNIKHLFESIKCLMVNHRVDSSEMKEFNKFYKLLWNSLMDLNELNLIVTTTIGIYMSICCASLVSAI